MAPDESPMGSLTRLRKRLRKDAAEVGLELKEFDARPHPDSESGPHRVRAIFTLTEDFDPTPKQPDELDKLLEGQREAEQKQKDEETKAGLSDLLRNLESGDGIL